MRRSTRGRKRQNRGGLNPVVVPIGGTMIIEAQILNRDVGQVRIGQPVAIKLEAFSFTRHGTIPGWLIDLSKDAVQDEKRGLIYQARIAIDCAMHKNLRNVTTAQQSTRDLCARAAPGMAATADIKTGERRIISFLLSPIQRRLAEAGREE
jgi:hemolysin D